MDPDQISWTSEPTTGSEGIRGLPPYLGYQLMACLWEHKGVFCSTAEMTRECNQVKFQGLEMLNHCASEIVWIWITPHFLWREKESNLYLGKVSLMEYYKDL